LRDIDRDKERDSEREIEREGQRERDREREQVREKERETERERVLKFQLNQWLFENKTSIEIFSRVYHLREAFVMH
jgi:hypothetical protein